MEATPEPDDLESSTASAVPELEDRDSQNFGQMPFDEAPGLEALSAAATSNYGYIRPLANPAHSPGGTLITHPSSNKLNFILNPDTDGSLGMYLSQILQLPALTCSSRRRPITAH
jgi:hypothetical protein